MTRTAVPAADPARVVTEVYAEPAAAGPGPAPADADLRPLLRRRLLVFVGLGVWGAGLYVLGRLLDLPSVRAAPGGLELLAVAGGLLVVAGTSFGLLLVNRNLSVRRLRAIELVGLAALCAQAAANTLVPVPELLLHPDAGTYPANNDIFLWFLTVTLYGVLIPNTLRRAARMTAGITALAAGVMLVAWSRYDLPASGWRMWLTNLVVFQGVAAGLMVFNSARLDEYRRAAARQVGHYRLTRPLGVGGMGEVFLAEHTLLKRPCAVKLIRPDKQAAPGMSKRFEREVAAATRLTHPAAVQVYDFGREADGTLYYVMEYLPGLTLEQAVRGGGPLSPQLVARVVREVAGALADAHAHGLVHRDVKPGNVMLCRLGGRSDAVKLLDFGLVADLSGADTRVTQAGGLLGTPGYMAPEQCRGDPDVGPAADLYALGATAYFLLAGRPPFESPTPLGLLHLHQTAAPPPLAELAPGVPPALAAVVHRLLAKHPADRFPDAPAVAAAVSPAALGWPADG